MEPFRVPLEKLLPLCERLKRGESAIAQKLWILNSTEHMI